MLSFLLLLLAIASVESSHYRGGTLGYSILGNTGNTTSNPFLSVLIYQRHSWRRSAAFCNDTRSSGRPMIGEGSLKGSYMSGSSTNSLPIIDASVPCTDFNEAYDYSSGEDLIPRMMPSNKRIEYYYKGCCWIPLLSPDTDEAWSLRMVINTQRRSDGKLNNAPKATINPVIQVQVGKTHLIRIPMADTDGDKVECRWGKTEDECGSICAPKGQLNANPCELTYEAKEIGHHGVALVIEDFDERNSVLSAVPLQFLIEIVNITSAPESCSLPPVYEGDWADGSCISAKSGQEIKGIVQFRIPCENTSTTLSEILTVSPDGFTTEQFLVDPNDPYVYTAEYSWVPTARQAGVQQACFTPITSDELIGSQICLTFHVDSVAPKLLTFSPTGVVMKDHSSWKIVVDQAANRPRRSDEVLIRFIKRSTNKQVLQINANSAAVLYQGNEILFYTTGQMWDEGEHYYILIGNGVAATNQSCGVESEPVTNHSTWTFEILPPSTTTSTTTTTTVTTTVTVTTSTTTLPTTTTTTTTITSTTTILSTTTVTTTSTTPKPSTTSTTTTTTPIPTTASTTVTSSTTPRPTTTSTTTTTTPIPTTTSNTASTTMMTSTTSVTTTTQEVTTTTATQPSSTTTVTATRESTTVDLSILEQLQCPRWLTFNTISMETVSAEHPQFVFCFTINTNFSDVLIAAHTWVSCTEWKNSGAADPFLELYSLPHGQLLAQNDDGINAHGFNCYAGVLSYRLPRGNYRVVIRAKKCAYGRFQLQLSAENGITYK